MCRSTLNVSLVWQHLDFFRHHAKPINCVIKYISPFHLNFSLDNDIYARWQELLTSNKSYMQLFIPYWWANKWYKSLLDPTMCPDGLIGLTIIQTTSLPSMNSTWTLNGQPHFFDTQNLFTFSLCFDVPLGWWTSSGQPHYFDICNLWCTS